MSLPDTLREFAGALETVGNAAAALSQLTKNTTDDRAAQVLQIVAAGLDAIVADLGVKVDPNVVQAHLDAYLKRERDDNAAIDAEIEKLGKPTAPSGS